MVKIGKPKGLIRYASYNSIKEGVQKLVNPRVIGYSFVLLALLSLLGFTLFSRSDIETNVFKVSGTLYQKTDDGFITNLYNVEFVNKTFDPISLQIKTESPTSASISRADGDSILVPAEGMLKTVCFIKMPASEIKNARTVIVVGIYKEEELIEKVNVKFIGPVGKPSDMGPRSGKTN
jgi:polyferredoxin